MIENLFDWYMEQTEKLDASAEDIILHGSFYGTNYYSIDDYIFEGFHFYMKKPHSLDFKEKHNIALIKGKKMDRGVIINDNNLCTMSELISEKKYRAYKYICAKHFTMPLGAEYIIMSPNMFLKDIEAAKLDSIDINAEYAEEFINTFDKNIYKHALNTSSYSLRKILRYKNKFLGFMTEHCYDQFVNYFLMSVPELTDDESHSNLMLVKPKSSPKFENVFVFDKESTAFNFMLANGETYETIKQKVTSLYRFCDVVLKGGNFNKRLGFVKDLFNDGLLEEKHKTLLESTLNVDYDKLADEVAAETGLPKNQDQIDLYKLGQDYTDKLIKGL